MNHRRNVLRMKCITDEIHTIFKIEDNLGLDDFKDDKQYY